MHTTNGVVTKILDLHDLGKICDARLLYSTYREDIPMEARGSIEAGLSNSPGAQWKRSLMERAIARKETVSRRFETELRKALAGRR